MTSLAINGGRPLRSTPFPSGLAIGDEEKRAVQEVLDSGVLSQFLGTWSPDFFGGPRVQKLESDWREYFHVRHAISLNSATSGLNAAIGALGLEPGDEVIVSPYTMSASAACVLVYSGIPVFADIDPDTFCLTPESIRARITPRTRGVVVVDLFGHPADWAGIRDVATEFGLWLVEDAAQAPGATYDGKFAGTLADIGVFSLNYHKAIHCGEGGIVVTNDDELAERVQLIRNHAEVVVKNKGTKNLVNMLGFNYRMTEIEAAIATEQLKKLEYLANARVTVADQLSAGLRGIPGLTTPVIRDNVAHGFYLYSMKYDERVTGVPRKVLANAIRAEGIPIFEAYVEPIYLQPLYQERIVFGSKGYPFTSPAYTGEVCYDKGICPVTERLYEREMLYTNVCHAGMTVRDVEDVVDGIAKVFNSIGELSDQTVSV